MKAARVNEGRSRLNATLRGYLFAEFWQPVDSDLGADAGLWPKAVVESLMLVHAEWRQDVGRIVPVARTYACVPTEDKRHACVLQITYARVRQQLDRPVPCIPGGTQAGGTEQVDAATPARPFSPSLCGAGIGGWGRH